MDVTETFNPGDAVEVHGLISAAQHNGKQGEILHFIPSKQRYAVRVPDDYAAEGLVINIKISNLCHVPKCDDATVAAAAGTLLIPTSVVTLVAACAYCTTS